MKKPNFEDVVERLHEYSQNLKDNSQLGNSKLMLAFAEMITVMGWQSSQQETNNTQTDNLILEMKALQATIEKSNENSHRLEQANYKLQMIMVFLTAIGTLVIAFPVLKIIFAWLAPFITKLLNIPDVSTTGVTFLAGVVTAIITFATLMQSRIVSSKVTKTKKDMRELIKKIEDYTKNAKKED